MVSLETEYVLSQAIQKFSTKLAWLTTKKPNLSKGRDGKPRVLASSEKPRIDSPKDPRPPSCRSPSAYVNAGGNNHDYKIEAHFFGTCGHSFAHIDIGADHVGHTTQGACDYRHGD